MKVCIVQHDIVWQNPTENIRRMDELLNQAPKADMYVLAEMWATGFGDKPQEDPIEAMLWMIRKSRELGVAIVGSLPVKLNNYWANRLYFAQPDFTLLHYDKRHLFSPGGEKECFAAGQERVVVRWGGVRWLLQVCYDLRFPVFSRNQDDYDVALYVANWPEKRRRVWDTLLHARALENQCYVVGVNRVGSDPQCDYDGGSVVVDAYGRTVASCQDGCEGMAVAELDLEQLAAFRKKFPVLNDRDHYTLL